MLMRPVGVNNAPLRANRVGRTQSKRSTPRATPIQRSSGEPTPIKYRGLLAGRISATISSISAMTGFGSPTLRPPIAQPATAADGNRGRAFPAQLGIHSALADAKERCLLLASVVSERVDAAGKPAMGAIGGISHCQGIRGQTDEMIERHHDIGSPTELQFHRQLRSELTVAAVDVGAKRDSVLANPHVPGQAENLEPPAIGEDGTIPTHEPMQPASGDEGFQTRSQHEVVGVGKDDLRARGAHFFWKQRLDGGLGTDRHERRGLDDSMEPWSFVPGGRRWRDRSQATRTETDEAS